MKKYLLIAVAATGLLAGCSSTGPTTAPTSAPTTLASTTTIAASTAPTTVLITTSVVAPPQSGSAVLRPVLQILKSTAAAPAELPAGSVVLTAEDGRVYLAGNVLSEGNIFADAEVKPEAGGLFSIGATLREASQGVDVFNSAAVGCINKDATCPSGVLAVVVNGTLVGTVSVRAAVTTPAIDLDGALSKDTAESFVGLITGRQ